MFKAAVICLASGSEQAGRIATRLKEAGFRRRNISALLLDREIAGRSKRGAAVGGLAWLAETAQLAVPGMGLLIGAGPIMAAMAGAAVVGSPNGGVAEALSILGMSEHQARQYEQRLNEGQVLMCVGTGSGAQAAAVMQMFVREDARSIVDVEGDSRGYKGAA